MRGTGGSLVDYTMQGEGMRGEASEGERRGSEARGKEERGHITTKQLCSSKGLIW